MPVGGSRMEDQSTDGSGKPESKGAVVSCRSGQTVFPMTGSTAEPPLPHPDDGGDGRALPQG